jgi:hypothetical protein
MKNFLDTAETDGVFQQGRHFVTSAPNVVVTVAMREQGLEAIARLVAEGIRRTARVGPTTSRHYSMSPLRWAWVTDSRRLCVRSLQLI